MKLKLPIIVLLCFSILFITISTVSSNEIIAKYGSHGKIVSQIQNYLCQLEYVKKSNIDGIYGKITREAVKSFQLEHCLEVTGIVDTETYSQLELSNRDEFVNYTVIEGDTIFSIAQKYNLSSSSLMVYNKLNEDSNIVMGQILKIPTDTIYLNKFASRGKNVLIPAIPWSIVNKLWKVGEVAMITDYETGKSFYVKRLGGRLHSDVIFLTRNDSVILHSLNSQWTWERRGVIVTIHKQRIAASINEMPHGTKNMICVHFAGSRIHASNLLDEEHLEAIETVEEDRENKLGGIE